MNETKLIEKGKIDWIITLVPLFLIIALCILFLLCQISQTKF